METSEKLLILLQTKGGLPVVALVTIAVILFYLAAVPVHVAFRVKTGPEFRFGLGVSLFSPRSAIRRACVQRKSLQFPKPPQKLHFPDALSALKTMLRHIRMDQIRLNGAFGTSDAAVTALVCGSISAISCILPPQANLCLTPDFSSDRLRMDLTGMITVRAGHIMTAALLGAFQYGFRRFKAWTSIPSKAL